MTMDTGGMFGKYLRREHGFKRLRSGEGRLCYFKHSFEFGCIYAFIEPGVRGVMMAVNHFYHRFENIATLSQFLGRLDAAGKPLEELMKSLYRSTVAKQLRTMML